MKFCSVIEKYGAIVSVVLRTVALPPVKAVEQSLHPLVFIAATLLISVPLRLILSLKVSLFNCLEYCFVVFACSKHLPLLFALLKHYLFICFMRQ